MGKLTRKQKILRRNLFLAVVAFILVGTITAFGFLIGSIVGNNDGGESLSASSDNGKENIEPYVVSTATVVNTGDILIHSPLLTAAYQSDTKDYDFSPFYKYTSSYFNKADLAVANLEVTLGGSESGKYSGYPAFNTPDSLIDHLKNAGIDMLLTSNNHCYDTGFYGLKRTARVLKEKNMPFIGTRETENEPIYTVKDIDSVKIGMACYTYENVYQGDDLKSINGRPVNREANNLLNSFSYERIDLFYTEAQNVIEDMKNNGAEAIVFYMHWGIEYHTTQNKWQEQIAQKLCDMGVDIIVGGHPHVIQPIELLTSTDGSRKTVCLYSMGNSISNQRLNLLYEDCPTGHTEDGMLFYFSFDKYSDGTVKLSGVDIVPAWCGKTGSGSNAEYILYPLENENSYSEYGLSSSTAKGSYNRTKKIIEEGLTKCQQYIGCTVRFQ